MVTLGLCTLSVLVKLSSDVKLQVHLEGLREAAPLLLAQSLRDVVGKLLLPDQDGALNIMRFDVTESEEYLLAFDNQLRLLVVQPCLCIAENLLIRLADGGNADAEEEDVHEQNVEVLGSEARLVDDVEGSNNNIGKECEDEQALQVVDDLTKEEERERHRIKYPREEKQLDERLDDDDGVEHLDSHQVALGIVDLFLVLPRRDQGREVERQAEEVVDVPGVGEVLDQRLAR